jgi:hypothetical protein
MRAARLRFIDAVVAAFARHGLWTARTIYHDKAFGNAEVVLQPSWGFHIKVIRDRDWAWFELGSPDVVWHDGGPDWLDATSVMRALGLPRDRVDALVMSRPALLAAPEEILDRAVDALAASKERIAEGLAKDHLEATRRAIDELPKLHA